MYVVRLDSNGLFEGGRELQAVSLGQLPFDLTPELRCLGMADASDRPVPRSVVDGAAVDPTGEIRCVIPQVVLGLLSLRGRNIALAARLLATPDAIDERFRSFRESASRPCGARLRHGADGRVPRCLESSSAGPD